MVGIIQADQSISFQLMQQKLSQFVTIIKKDPAVESVVGFTGGGQTNSWPSSSRHWFRSASVASPPTASLGPGCGMTMAVVPGQPLFLQAVQDIRVGLD